MLLGSCGFCGTGSLFPGIGENHSRVSSDADQDARAQGQNTDVLEKQINERQDGVLSRWLLLKNHSLPETAIIDKGGGK
ncbi:hypothetical protein NIN64_004560 [Escherichia coli]|nr:hypothetical protein [Escherichia coli]